MLRISSTLPLLLGLGLSLTASSQQLQLEKQIPVAGMTGGFDHLAYDPATQRIFATAEDQGKVYVLSLISGQLLAKVDGFGKPHSVLARAGASSVLVVDSEKSKSALLSATSLKVMSRVAMPPGANALVYDQKIGRAIITAGGDRVHMNTSQIAAIDPATGRTLKSVEVNALHLQPMAIDEMGGRVFVSIADHKSVGVFDVVSLRMIAEWKLGPEPHHHQPVAFDAEHHRLFIAIDQPGELVVVNTDNGKRISSLAIPGDADDLTFDAVTHRLFVPCGDGFLMVLDATNPDHLRTLQKLATGKDAATGMWLPNERTYLLGVPQSGAMNSPEIQVFALR